MRINSIIQSLRYKIFISILIILIVSSLVIFITSVIQYREEAKDYNLRRLERKEKALRESVNLIIRNTTFPVKTENIPLIFKEHIHQIANIHNLNFEIYDLQGRLLISSVTGFGKDTVFNFIPPDILSQLEKQPDKKLKIEEKNIKGDLISAYSYITDLKFKPIGILYIPYESRQEFYQYEIREFLSRLAKIYLVLILLAVGISFFISKNITKSLSIISDHIKKTDIVSKNQKLEIKNVPEELTPLIDSYNQMVEKLERNTKRLIQIEKESAWGEMARQIAHEIKNPLTPMRLSIEHFIYTFQPDNPENPEKVRQFGNMLLEQIDALNHIAQAFSDYTKISDLKLEYDNLIETIQNTIRLFPKNVEFKSDLDSLYMYYDKTRIKQALVNLIRNALQAGEENQEVKVKIKVYQLQSKVFVEIEDNGTGIPEEILDHIFEPKFTTKSSGTGLGLSIVKRIIESHGGDILIETHQGKGTKFILILPLKNTENEI